MSKMGRAVQWVQENGLQDHPEALTKYIEHLSKQKNNDGGSEQERTEESESSRDSKR